MSEPQITIRIPSGMLAELDAIAEATERTRSGCLRLALKEWLARQPEQDEPKAKTG